MKRLFIVPIFILAAAVSFPSLAQADQITAIQVLPASPTQGSPVAVKLLGTGDCQNLDLSWGDGTPDFPHNPNFNLPSTFPIQHTYQSPGTKTIKINDVKGCQGKGLTKTITVAFTVAGGVGGTVGGIITGGGISLADLCKHVDCGTLLRLPKIDNLVAFSNFTPGGVIAVVGSGFGNSPGELHIHGITPNGAFQLPAMKIPGIFLWSDTSIQAIIPSGITGVIDQSLQVHVVTANNAKSNSYTVLFTATREVRKIPYGDSAVSVVSCGIDSNDDQCNDWHDPSDGGPGVNFSTWGVTLAANHLNCILCIGDDVGFDVYQVNVANGWVLDQMNFTFQPSDPGEAWANLDTSFLPGANAWQPSVSWSVTPNDFVHYMVDVYIVGPKGVPIH